MTHGELAGEEFVLIKALLLCLSRPESTRLGSRVRARLAERTPRRNMAETLHRLRARAVI
jgi:hypothetical protein